MLTKENTLFVCLKLSSGMVWEKYSPFLLR